uniref:Uncharacterized protein n=1 Tax=Cacopsylla melanoneura TaxID=428564 RepID=A0A8D9A7Q5_9HEMI
MFPISSVVLLSCLLHLAVSASPQDSKDAQVIIYNGNRQTNTLLKVFVGDQFRVNTLTKLDNEEDFAGINFIKITQTFQSPRGVRKVTFGLESVDDDVLELTSLSPAIPVDDGSENFVSASRNNIFHSLVVTDKNNVILPNSIIGKIVLTPFDSFFGRRVEISPKSS